MTPEQIEKERQAFEVWIHPTENDPEDLLEWSDCGGYLYGRIRDYWRAWLARANQSAWVSVEDRLPAEGSAAIVLYSDCGQLLPSIGYYCEDREMFFDENEYEIWDVIYWQPLPTPPKGE